MKLKLNLSKFAGVLFIAFLVTIFVAKMFQILVLMYAGILCAAVGICLADDNQRVGACLLLLPNIRMFDGLSISFLVNILLVLPVIAYILEHRRVNFVALSHCMMFAAWDICHVLFFNQLSRLLPNLSTIVVLYYVECVLIDRSTYICFDDVSRKFAFGCIYSAFVSWIVMSYNFSFEYAWARISAWRLSGYAGDPNYFALYVCISLAMLLSQKYHLKRDYVYVFLLIALALLTTSKMSLIILLVIFLFFAGKALYSFLANRNRFLRRLTVIGIAVAMLFSAQIADLINGVLTRFQEHNGTAVTTDTITSNRLKIMTFYLQETLTQPMLLLFGYGLQYNETPDYTSFFHIAHNTFLDVVLSWGLVGLGMMVIVFYYMVCHMNRIRREKLTANHFFPMTVCALSFLSLSCFSSTMFWWTICAVMLPLKGLEIDENSPYFRSHSGVQRRKLRLRVRRVAS